MARVARIITGFTLVAAGLFMLVLPGPGVLTILAGLAVLGRDLPWAARLSNSIKRRFVGRHEEIPALPAGTLPAEDPGAEVQLGG
jgi:hypothetical protein